MSEPIIQPVKEFTKVIEIVAQGPQGPEGPPGQDGAAAVTVVSPILNTGPPVNPIIEWLATQADVVNRHLLNAGGQIVLEWGDYVRSAININPDLPDDPFTDILNTIVGQVDPIAATTQRNIIAQQVNIGIDPFQTGFAFNQATVQQLSFNHVSDSALQYADMLNVGANLGDGVGGSINQFRGMNFYASMNSGYSMNDYYGFILGSNFAAGSVFTGTGNIVQLTANPEYRSTGMQNVHGVDMYAQLYGNVAQGVNVFAGSYNVYGSSGYFVDAQFGSQFRSTSTTPDYKGINISPSFDVGSVNTSLTLINAAPNGNVEAIDSAIGLYVNMDNVTVTTGNNKRATALSVSGGFVNSFYSTKSDSGLFFDAVNQLIVQMNVDSGSPLTSTELISHSLISLSLALDDYAVGPLGLGMVNLLSGGQVSVATGKTIDRLSNILAGRSVPAQPGDGGTITDNYDFRAFGLVDVGGVLNVTNYYGFAVDAAANSGYPATNAWGVYIADTTLENWFAKSVAIGGTTGKVADAGYALEMAEKKALKFTPMTTAERDALFPTPAKGTQIFNDTTNTLQVWDGSAWI